jgi:hypothetical protein
MSDLTDEAANEILQNTDWCKFSDAREMIQDVYAMGMRHAAAVSAAENERLRTAMREARVAICNWPEGAQAMLDDALLATPTGRTVPLTDEQIRDIRIKLNHASAYCHGHGFDVALARAIEAAHGIAASPEKKP